MLGGVVDEDICNVVVKSLPVYEDKRTMRMWSREPDLKSLYWSSISSSPFSIIPLRNDSKFFLQVKNDQVNQGEQALGAVQFPAFNDKNDDDLLETLEGINIEDLFSKKERCESSTSELYRYREKYSIPPGFNYGIDFAQSSAKVTEDDENAEEPADSDKGIIPLLTSSSASQVVEEAKVAADFDFGLHVEEQDDVIDLGPAPRKNDELNADIVFNYAISINVNMEVKNFREKVPVLAHKYPFELDIFQKQAILRLENGDTVFVAAHTSAGKTVVAEYAIALCKQHFTKAIYTSPIKALSNQKYRDFKLTFGNVGLLTGDIQLNPDAFCLVMTTEILRSMLLNKSQTLRDLEWVIFDEVHYINDIERGLVWEEVLIFLPKSVKIIMLSATVSNTMAFAEWVGRLKDRKVYVISTLKRPVPLEHYLYTGSDGKTKSNRFLLVDKNSKINKSGYYKAKDTKVERKEGTKKLLSTLKNKPSERNMWIHLIDHLGKNELLPCVAFTFSRKRCDENAKSLNVKTLNLLSETEKSHVHHFFERCILKLKDVDRQLPQILLMKELCKQGLAIHHSGILPILKEIVEMLFQRNLIKVLFATETFAMGVNMPAKTVIFDSIEKHDGKTKRRLKPGEYTQMAGRAGRRGMDKTGTVIMLCKVDVPELHDLEAMILGKPDELSSQFRLTYALILNSLRDEEFQVEEILAGSFAESVTWREKALKQLQVDNLQKRLSSLEQNAAFTCKSCPNDEFYSQALKFIQIYRKYKREYAILELRIGQLIGFSFGRFKRKIGVVLRLPESSKVKKSIRRITLLTLDEAKKYETDQRSTIIDDQKKWVEFDLQLFDFIDSFELCTADRPENSTGAFTFDENDSQLFQSAKTTLRTIEISVDQLVSSFPDFGCLNTLDVQALAQECEKHRLHGHKFYKVDEHVLNIIDRLNSDVEKFDGYEINFFDYACSKDGNVEILRQNLYQMYHERSPQCAKFLQHFATKHEYHKAKYAKDSLSNLPSKEVLQLSPEYASKMQTLQQLDYVDNRQLLTMKGKVACYINNFELLISEMLLENLLGPLTPAQIAAVLSATTCQHKIYDIQRLPDHLFQLKNKTLALADRLNEVQETNQVMDSDFVDKLSFSLMEVVHDWANGASFVELMSKTDAPEGIIVRCIIRLDEVCRDVRSAAKLLGDVALQNKMDETSAAIKRDIIFAASLYTIM